MTTKPNYRIDPGHGGGSLMGQVVPARHYSPSIQDHARVEAMRTAIQRIVKANDKVLDLGGGTGVLSQFAARRAAKVWCVEPNAERAQACRRFLDQNEGSERVEVISTDASAYIPPEPVDVVICEMLQPMLVRESRLPVLSSFKHRYRQRFGGRQPTFIPQCTELSVQAVQHTFQFASQSTPAPHFQAPALQNDATTQLTERLAFAAMRYDEEFSARFTWQGRLTAVRPGKLNALRFFTDNVLSPPGTGDKIHWQNRLLLVPMAQPLSVRAGDEVCVALDYDASQSLDALLTGLSVARVVPAEPRRVAA